MQVERVESRTLIRRPLDVPGSQVGQRCMDDQPMAKTGNNRSDTVQEPQSIDYPHGCRIFCVWNKKATNINMTPRQLPICYSINSKYLNIYIYSQKYGRLKEHMDLPSQIVEDLLPILALRIVAAFFLYHHVDLWLCKMELRQFSPDTLLRHQRLH